MTLKSVYSVYSGLGMKGIIVGWVILKVTAPRRLGWPDTPLSLASGNSTSGHPRVLWAIVFIITIIHHYPWPRAIVHQAILGYSGQ